MIVSALRLDRQRDRFARALTDDRSTCEILGPCLNTIVDQRMNRDCTGHGVLLGIVSAYQTIAAPRCLARSRKHFPNSLPLAKVLPLDLRTHNHAIPRPGFD